jgi:hypothetical protein
MDGRLTSAKYFEMKDARCVIQLQINVLLKTVVHNWDVSSLRQNIMLDTIVSIPLLCRDHF